jgi:hypothetical protein
LGGKQFPVDTANGMMVVSGIILIMKTIEKNQFDEIIGGAQILSRDDYGSKVFRLRDGRIMKLFRRKRLVSTALVWPYATRFARGARKLRERKIATVTVTAVFRIKGMNRDAVIYRPIAGHTLRHALSKAQDTCRLLSNFARFLAKVHDKGIYFRSIHFGNVILLPDDDFGLIDLADVHAHRHPLGLRKRLRNVKHMICYPDDHQTIIDFGIEAFVDIYLKKNDFSSRVRDLYIRQLQG